MWIVDHVLLYLKVKLQVIEGINADESYEFISNDRKIGKLSNTNIKNSETKLRQFERVWVMVR